LSELKNIQKKKEEAVSLRWVDTYKAYLWVKEHQNLFKDRVYGPVCLEMSVDNPLHSLYLEQCLGTTLGAFIVLSTYDRDVLMEELCTKQSLRLQILYTPNLEAISHSHPCSISTLQPQGITHFLDEVFKCDPIIKKTLCNFGIHTIGAGTEYTEQHFDRVWTDTQIREFYTPQAQHRKTQSAYGDRLLLTMRIPLRHHSDSVLSAKADEREEAILHSKNKNISQELERIEEEIQNIQKLEGDIKDKTRDVKNQKSISKVVMLKLE